MTKAPSESPCLNARLEEASKIGRFWDSHLISAAPPARSSWYTEPCTIRHINRVVCGEEIDGLHAGFHKRLARMCSHFPKDSRAISIGSGIGTKEMDALKLGIIHHFDCYELSAEAINRGRDFAKSHSLIDRITFHNIDPFARGLEDKTFDLVYWNNALHHMFDAAEAVRWSRKALKLGGVFAIDDYVGPSRFQHSEATLAAANKILAGLPDRLLKHWDGTRLVPRVHGLCDPADIERIDPSEAVDSSSILPAIQQEFPNAKIIRTGGVVYFIALNEALQNFESEADLALLNTFLLADEALANIVETQYAVAFAQRD